MTGRENDVGFMIRQIHGDLGCRVNNRLRAEGLTSSQLEVLHYLGTREGEGSTLRDLEEYLGVTHPTVVGLVRRLGEKGLVNSGRDPRDGRARNLTLTAKAREQQDRLLSYDRVKDTEAMLTRGFTDGERAELVRLLRRVQQNLKDG